MKLLPNLDFRLWSTFFLLRFWFIDFLHLIITILIFSHFNLFLEWYLLSEKEKSRSYRIFQVHLSIIITVTINKSRIVARSEAHSTLAVVSNAPANKCELFHNVDQFALMLPIFFFWHLRIWCNCVTFNTHFLTASTSLKCHSSDS